MSIHFCTEYELSCDGTFCPANFLLDLYVLNGMEIEWASERKKKLDLITKVHRTMKIFIMERVFISTMDFIFLSNKCWQFFDIFLIAEHEMVFDESRLNVQFDEQLPMAQQKWIKCYSGFFFLHSLSFSLFLSFPTQCTACPSLNARKT